MAPDTPAELLAEGKRLVAKTDALSSGASMLPLYLRLKDVIERAELLLKEERS